MNETLGKLSFAVSNLCMNDTLLITVRKTISVLLTLLLHNKVSINFFILYYIPLL